MSVNKDRRILEGRKRNGGMMRGGGKRKGEGKMRKSELRNSKRRKRQKEL